MRANFFPVTTSDNGPTPPAGWSWRILKDVARLESGHTPSRREPSYWDGGKVPWLSLKDIRGLSGRYVVDTEDMPTQAGIDNSSARVLPKGTVAFCRTASVGKVAILGRDMATSQDFANWVCGPELVPEYLYEALQASGGQFEKEKQGTTHKTIYMPVLERFRVLVPPLAKQRAIADVLEKANTICCRRREAIALTKELLRSTFLEMFGDPVTNSKGWPVKSLGDVSDVAGGLQVTTARASHPIAMPYLRVANVYRDRLELSEVKEIRVTEAERARATLRHGDVLVIEGHGNPEELGRSAVWRDEIPGCTHQNHLIRVRATAGVLDATFLSAFLNSSSGKKQMLALGKTTSGLNTISTNNVRSVEIVVPPLKRQLEYADMAERIAALGRTMQRCSASAEGLLSSLRARAFSGLLDVAC